MHQITIGIDPDSNAHGVAVYLDDALVKLVNLTLCEVVELGKEYVREGHAVKFHIENVAKNKAYWHNKSANKASFGKASADMGLCRQAQVELTRALEFNHLPYMLHHISRMWKDQPGRKQFERATGWTGRSNADTRSAAYFGFIGLRFW